MKKIIFLLICFSFLLVNPQAFAISGSDGELIKTNSSSAVYLVKNSTRYAFPDQKTYQSWYGDDFSQVKTTSFEELSSYRLSGLVTYKPGSLIKIQSDPKVYEVLDDIGSISWVSSEQIAINKFGTNWASLVRDVPASFFVNYTITGNTGDGINLDTGNTTSQCSFEQTPAQPGKEVNLIKITNNNITDVSPDIAWSGSKYGIVWVESTNSSNDYFDLYFTTIDSNNIGNKIKIDTTSVESLRPKIIWDGNNFVIVWRGAYKFVESNGAINETVSLYFTKINADGNIVIPAKSVTGIRADSFVSLADGNSGYAVAWDNSPTGTLDTILNKEIFFANLDSSGNLIGSGKQITDYDQRFSAYPKLVEDAVGYGLFWKDRKDGGEDNNNDEVYFTRLDENGNKLITEIRLTNADSSLESVTTTWDGSKYALVYWDSRDGGNYYFNLISTTGTKEFFSDIKINEIGRDGTSIDVAYVNNQYYIVASYIEKDLKFQDGPEMYTFIFDKQGNKIEENRLTYNPWGSRYPSIAAGNNKAALVWVESRGQVTERECELGNSDRNEIYFTELE